MPVGAVPVFPLQGGRREARGGRRIAAHGRRSALIGDHEREVQLHLRQRHAGIETEVEGRINTRARSKRIEAVDRVGVGVVHVFDRVSIRVTHVLEGEPVERLNGIERRVERGNRAVGLEDDGHGRICRLGTHLST